MNSSKLTGVGGGGLRSAEYNVAGVLLIDCAPRRDGVDTPSSYHVHREAPHRAMLKRNVVSNASVILTAAKDLCTEQSIADG